MALLNVLQHSRVTQADRVTCHPVHKALHRPLTVCGVDRRLFFLALLLGAATFNVTYSLLAGLVLSALLFVGARWATAHDPDLLRILVASARTRHRYDPLQHGRVEMAVVR